MNGSRKVSRGKGQFGSNPKQCPPKPFDLQAKIALFQAVQLANIGPMTSPRLTLSGLNALPASSFVAALGEVFEHAPWVAEAAAAGRPYPTVTALHDAMMQAVRQAAGRAAGGLHRRPSGARQPGQARRPDRPFPVRTGRARPRPAQRRGVRPLHPAQRRLPGEIRLSLHRLRPPPHPGFDPAPVRAPARARRRSRTRRGARTRSA